jgi:hypothetical protein
VDVLDRFEFITFVWEEQHARTGEMLDSWQAPKLVSLESHCAFVHVAPVFCSHSATDHGLAPTTLWEVNKKRENTNPIRIIFLATLTTKY